ncbi:CDP-glycerol poly(glycerophosphate) glycerophosphotransferase [Lentilactobacillus diolivorans DSM 14421]|uniref:CDP-glycerol poly(Glycerophosphate) glycerophosphotransferase n=1 Tax=Lentilactobacillus diolivorans DSM 14421 TaxID=1423739 RepID=A0A0R1S5U7_9LACO|nr:CDP-glycerol poly(glycerophosphate) glycerophosphotransferase [Lentilactobacillus diolivorans DSM 14421]
MIHFLSLINIWRPKNKVIYLMSFDNNVDFIKQLAQRLPNTFEFVVLYHPDTEAAATDLAAFGIRTRPFKDGIKLVLDVVPLIMGARLIFCDNYYAFLGGIIHLKMTKIVQIWHANGAIKKFGWEDPTTKYRSKSDQKRFQEVYNQFDEYIVASKAMGHVFTRSYREDFDKIKLLGYPRSDQYVDSGWRQTARERIYQAAPELKNRRVILYAPTYRENQAFKLPAGIGDALAADPNAMVVVKFHPILREKENLMRETGNSRIKFYHQLATNDLLTVTDTLVTDYSSVAFDFTLLPNAKSLIFFMFDMKNYQNNPGIQDNFMDWLPTKPVTTIHDLRDQIIHYESTNFSDFNHYWNTYNDGHATDRVIDRYLKFLKS